MEMQNFDPEFQTPEQYIIDITYRIWEERGVGRIRDWYTPHCPVRTPHGETHTVEDVILYTLAGIAEFPNRDVLAEDVIIGDKPSGFLSSHRVRSVGTHAGDGNFGHASHRQFIRLGIADCLCRDNRVVEEWVLRDQAGLVQQLGHDPVEFGNALGTQDPDAYTIGSKAMRQRWDDPEGFSIVGDAAVANHILSTSSAIWNDKNLNIMDERYDRAIRFEGPAGQLCYGRDRTGLFLVSVMASIPDGRFEPHHVIVRQRPNRAISVALRWSYCGTHAGKGRYGKPTGFPVAILGISHFELHDGLIANEFMVVDETAVYAQIAAYQLTT